jgi:crotonobetainyl-CoA:carnitine CoA-transferase CaiB-like acyl-CoA transferase
MWFSGPQGTPVEYRRAPPCLGEHTAEVLHDILGMDAAEMRALVDQGVIGVHDDTTLA